MTTSLKSRLAATLLLFVLGAGLQSCSGGGSSESGAPVTTAGGSTPTTGLDFPSNSDIANGSTVRFKFANPQASGLPIYGPNGAGATYIFQIYPKQQSGYYTTFFWGNDDGQGTLATFLWKNGTADSYFGMHPYPDGGGNTTTSHHWEVSVEQADYVNGTVAKGRWYTQAVRVWSDTSGKHHEFYWDLPNADASHLVTHTSPATWGNSNPPAPALTFGDAPWSPGNELCSCILRGIQIYSSKLSLADIQSEITAPQSSPAGAASLWYLNLNPTPTDIADKGGNGHNPDWVGSLRPTLYTGP